MYTVGNQITLIPIWKGEKKMWYKSRRYSSHQVAYRPGEGRSLAIVDDGVAVVNGKYGVRMAMVIPTGCVVRPWYSLSPAIVCEYPMANPETVKATLSKVAKEVLHMEQYEQSQRDAWYNQFPETIPEE